MCVCVWAYLIHTLRSFLVEREIVKRKQKDVVVVVVVSSNDCS